MGFFEDVFLSSNPRHNYHQMHQLRESQRRERRSQGRLRRSQQRTDAEQDERIANLEAENEDLALYISHLVRLLVKKGLVGEAELAAVGEEIQRACAAPPALDELDPMTD